MIELHHLTPELVGRRYPEFKFHITSQWVRDYKEALGFSYLMAQDDASVPNSFVACLRDCEFCVFSDLGVDLSQLLHAGQSYQFKAPIRVGDWISGQSEIVKVVHKNGVRGEIVFVDIKNVFRRIGTEAGGPLLEPIVLVEATMSVVVRKAS
jgi:hypothetical protein